MKIAHWSLKNGSGMHRVAEDMAKMETSIGLESVCVAPGDSTDIEWGMGADVHVNHTHVPDSVLAAGGKVVWIGHGTPEHCFMTSVEEGLNRGYGASDPWMMVNYWLQRADAVVTFWERHRLIWKTLADRSTPVHLIPMGIDRDFWKPVQSPGKFTGEPSVFTAENCHFIKWPLDLVIMWPWIAESVPSARLHMAFLPSDQHRWWFPLLYRTGTLYKAYVEYRKYEAPRLREVFSSVDFYFNPLRYGDQNHVGLEARASGCKVISFAGNPYADFWITEGDQRRQAEEMKAILKGQVESRESLEPPGLPDMAQGMLKVYEAIV